MDEKATDQSEEEEIDPAKVWGPDGKFLPGNPYINKSPGRPKAIHKRQREEDALKMMRHIFKEKMDLEEIVERMVENAFFHENKNGTFGSVHWARLALLYAIGPPPVKVETQHTNLVEMVRLAAEQQAAEAKTIDVEIIEDA